MRPNIPALTSLRFFAALTVVVFHYGVARPSPWFHADFGYEAVTFFFILSGFVLVYAHGIPDGSLNVSLKAFIKSRFVRIGPAYYIAIVIVISLYFTAGILSRLNSVTLGLVLTMLQSWTPKFALSVNLPAWSLSNEMFFYLLFPFFWRATCRMGLVQSLTVSLGLVLVAAFARALSYADADEIMSSFRRYFPLLNLPQFILGISLGYAMIAGPYSKRKHATFFVTGMLALAILVVLQLSFGWLSNSVTMSAICSSIIFGAAGIGGIVQSALSFRPLVILGEASYSIYILHFPIWLWWNHYTRIAYSIDWPPALGFGIYLSIVLTISIAALFWLERPAKRILRVERPWFKSTF